MSAERIPQETIPNWELHHGILNWELHRGTLNWELHHGTLNCELHHGTLNWELHHGIFCVKSYYVVRPRRFRSSFIHFSKYIENFISQSSKTGSVSLRRIRLRLTLIVSPLTVPAILDDLGHVHRKF